MQSNLSILTLRNTLIRHFVASQLSNLALWSLQLDLIQAVELSWIGNFASQLHDF